MIKVYCSDGAVFEGKTPKDIVLAMKMDTWEPPPTPADYMKQVARRAKIWDGWGIKYQNEVEFLEELQRIGVITKVEMAE